MTDRYLSRKHATNVILQSLQLHWLSIGTIDADAAGNDEALGVDERTYQSVKDLDNVVVWLMPYGVNSLIARFLLSTNDADVDIDVWVGRIKSDPRADLDADADIQRLCVLDVICGQQESYAGGKFADTIEVSNDVSSHGVFVARPDDDHMAVLKVDISGVNVVIFHGYGTFDEDCEVQVSGY